MAEQLKEHIKDPGSAITHFIGMLMAIFAAIPLLLKAAREPSKIYIIAIAVYAASLILLYAASTTYHTFDKSRKVNTILKKIDHMMISVLIAGSYTPICLLVLGGRTGLILLAIVWVSHCYVLYGHSRLSASLSKPSGYSVRNGFLPCSISAWAGPVSWHLHSY